MPNASLDSPPRLRSRGFTLYLAIWIVLGALAAGYLVALAFKPDLLAASLRLLRPGAGTEGENQKVVEEVRSLRDSVSQVQMDVARLSADAEEQKVHNREFDTRISALEARPALAATATESATAAAQQPQGAAPEQAPVQDKEAAASAGGEAGHVLETGSVRRTAAAAPAQTPAKPAGKPTGIQIGEAASLDALRVNWLALSDRHAQALKNLEARYTQRGKQTYELIAGPLKTPAEAKKICEALAGDNIPCKIAQFGGNVL